MSASKIGLVVIALLIPVVGFIMTLNHARGGADRHEARWRKRHGLLFWTLLPALAGIMTTYAALAELPDLWYVIGVAVVGLSILASWTVQQKHEERGR